MFVEANDFRVLVIGGLREGTRKARRWISAGAEVRVLSLEFSDELTELSSSGKVRLIRGDLMSDKLEELIEWSDLVVYAGPPVPEYEERVISISRRERKLLNLSTSAERTQVVMPIECRSGGIRVAVTTEGLSTLISKDVVKRLCSYLDEQEDIHSLLEVMGHIKRYMKRHVKDHRVRMKLYYVVFRNQEVRRAALLDVERAKKIAEEIVRREAGIQI